MAQKAGLDPPDLRGAVDNWEHGEQLAYQDPQEQMYVIMQLTMLLSYFCADHIFCVCCVFL